MVFLSSYCICTGDLNAAFFLTAVFSAPVTLVNISAGIIWHAGDNADLMAAGNKLLTDICQTERLRPIVLAYD